MCQMTTQIFYKQCFISIRSTHIYDVLVHALFPKTDICQKAHFPCFGHKTYFCKIGTGRCTLRCGFSTMLTTMQDYKANLSLPENNQNFIHLSIWRPSWFGVWWELLKICLFVCKCTPPPCCDLLLLSCTCARACRARVSRAETLHKQTFWVGNGLAAGTNWCRVTNVNVNKNTNMNTTLKYGQCLKGVTD